MFAGLGQPVRDITSCKHKCSRAKCKLREKGLHAAFVSATDEQPLSKINHHLRPVEMAPKRSRVGASTKFGWNEELIVKFIDMCLEYQSTNGIDQPFSWVEIAGEFSKVAGKVCLREHAKNKFDHMKKRWTDWKRLKHGETGLGWDSEKGTIRADPDWWNKKIKENPDMKKFRKKGISPEIEEKWDCLFGGIFATSQHCVAPSMDPYAPRRVEEEDEDEDDDDNGDDADGDDYESHSDDDFENLYGIDLDQPDTAILQDVIKEVSAPLPTSSKEKKKKGGACSTPSSQTQQKKKTQQSARCVLYNQHLEMVGQASQKIVKLLEADAASSVASPVKNNLEGAMDVVDQLVLTGDMKEGDSLWCFTVNELGKDEARELFLTIRSNPGRVAWLKYRFGLQNGP